MLQRVAWAKCFFLMILFLAPVGVLPQTTRPLHRGKATRVTLQFSKNAYGEIEVQTLLPIRFRVEWESGDRTPFTEMIRRCEMYNIDVAGRLEARIRCGKSVYKVTGYVLSRER